MIKKIDYKITLEEARQIAENHCKQFGYSYEKLMSFKTHYSAPMPIRDDCWIWYKPYDGPMDKNWFGLDKYMPYFILAVHYDGRVVEADHIDLIKL